MTDRARTRNELLNWLGDTVTLTGEQMDHLIDASLDIDQRYPDEDEQLERDAALSAALQYLLGETTPDIARETLVSARAAERRAYVAALQMAVMAHRLGGVDKAPAARAAGIDRMRLLRALGERE